MGPHWNPRSGSEYWAIRTFIFKRCSKKRSKVVIVSENKNAAAKGHPLIWDDNKNTISTVDYFSEKGGLVEQLQHPPRPTLRSEEWRATSEVLDATKSP